MELSKEQERVRSMYRNVFQSAHGKEVLEDLMEEFYNCYIDPADQPIFSLGQRDVVQSILDKVNADE